MAEKVRFPGQGGWGDAASLASNGAFGSVTGNASGTITLTLTYNGQSITKTITIK